MKKITEITTTRFRTIHGKDAYGNRTRDTEEYVALRGVNCVTPGKRIVHLVVDAIVFGIAYNFFRKLLIWLVVFFDTNIFTAIYHLMVANYSLYLFIPMLYAFCEFKWQQTPGKFLTKSIVIDEYGNRPELGAIVIRSLIRLIPFEAFSCIEDSSYGWHDKWSNTWVVTKEELAIIKELQAENPTE